MARQPEVFVRSLDPEEAQRLVKITRTTKDRVRLRRAGIVLASVQGRSATEAAAMFAMKPQYAREVIHAFNEQGFAALDPKWSGGRPSRFGPPVRETVCRVAKTRHSSLAARSPRGACRSWSSTWPSTRASPSVPSRCARSSVRRASGGRRPRPGRRARTRTSPRRWPAFSISTTIHQPMGG
jgi:helix-turn-helix protein